MRSRRGELLGLPPRLRGAAIAAAGLLAAFVAAGCAPVANSHANQGVKSVTLADYQLTATYALPPNLAAEASAVTFDWDTGTLFVQGDGGKAILEITREGVPASSMKLKGFQDTEGLTYIGGGKFVTLEERIARAYVFTYQAGGTLNRVTLQSVPVGPNTGTNAGNEGISFEPSTGLYFTVKERDPQAVYKVTADFALGTSTIAEMFDPALLAVGDIADIQVLSTVSTLKGTPDQDSLLLLSQASARLLKVTRDGTVLEAKKLGALSKTLEGVTIDDHGVIYLVDDSPKPRLFVLTPRP